MLKLYEIYHENILEVDIYEYEFEERKYFKNWKYHVKVYDEYDKSRLK